jgi:hypothetical protein
LYVEEKAHGTNKHIDGFYRKTAQKRGFSKLCVKIKKHVIPTYSIFNSPDPKGHLSYCHHLASVVVVRPKTFQSSSKEPLKQMEPNVTGMFIYMV